MKAAVYHGPHDLRVEDAVSVKVKAPKERFTSCSGEPLYVQNSHCHKHFNIAAYPLAIRPGISCFYFKMPASAMLLTVFYYSCCKTGKRRVPPPGDLQGNPAEGGILAYRVWRELHPRPADHDGLERDIPLPRLSKSL